MKAGHLACSSGRTSHDGNLLHFNQQWVGDHTEEWFWSRAPLAMAVVEEMKAAGVYVFAGGLEEDGPVWGARIAEGCGWPHEIRRFGRHPQLD